MPRWFTSCSSIGQIKTSIGFQQSPGEPKTLLHHRQPFAVVPRIVLVDVSVVIFPISSARVEGRIDVDTVHPALVEVDEELQRVKILSIDDGVVRLVPGTATQHADGTQRGVYWISKAFHHKKILRRQGNPLTPS